MPFNINAFKFDIDTYSYLKTNAFEVYVFTPPILRDFELSNAGTPVSLFSVNRHLKMRIEQVTIPGMTIQSTDVRRYGIGTVQKMPVAAQAYGDITFSILLDGYGEIYHFWEAWLRKIYEFNGTTDSPAGNVGNAFPSYVSEYKDQFSADMLIVVYDQFGNTIQKINLKEAFPSSMKDIQLAWASDGLMRLQVGISYTEHTIEKASLLEILAQQGVNFGLTAINRAITS
jgi:hypothetical protein